MYCYLIAARNIVHRYDTIYVRHKDRMVPMRGKISQTYIRMYNHKKKTKKTPNNKYMVFQKMFPGHFGNNCIVLLKPTTN